MIRGALAGVLVLTAAVAAGAQPSQIEVTAQVAAETIAKVKAATLGAIAEVPAGSKVEDYEGAILFAIDQLQASPDLLDAGLLAAEETLPDGPAKTAIENIRRMKLRLAGTRSVPDGADAVLSGPNIGGTGGGGTGTYGN